MEQENLKDDSLISGKWSKCLTVFKVISNE